MPGPSSISNDPLTMGDLSWLFGRQAPMSSQNVPAMPMQLASAAPAPLPPQRPAAIPSPTVPLPPPRPFDPTDAVRQGLITSGQADPASASVVSASPVQGRIGAGTAADMVRQDLDGSAPQVATSSDDAGLWKQLIALSKRGMISADQIQKIMEQS